MVKKGIKKTGHYQDWRCYVCCPGYTGQPFCG